MSQNRAATSRVEGPVKRVRVNLLSIFGLRWVMMSGMRVNTGAQRAGTLDWSKGKVIGMRGPRQ